MQKPRFSRSSHRSCSEEVHQITHHILSISISITATATSNKQQATSHKPHPPPQLLSATASVCASCRFQAHSLSPACIASAPSPPCSDHDRCCTCHWPSSIRFVYVFDHAHGMCMCMRPMTGYAHHVAMARCMCESVIMSLSAHAYAIHQSMHAVIDVF